MINKKTKEVLIRGYEQIIEHYDFVISDLEGENADKSVEAAKPSAIGTLKKMREQWSEALDKLRSRETRDAEEN